jgi:hypothetical protein
MKKRLEGRTGVDERVAVTLALRQDIALRWGK